MALHRKAAPLMALAPDIAVIAECASPDVLAARGLDLPGLWTGDNPNKGLGVFAFNGHRISAHRPHHPTLRHLLPVTVDGTYNLLAVWAQNASAGITRKHQLGPLRRGLTKYRDFLTARPAIVGGDLNNNVHWDRPGWRINHARAVAHLDRLGLKSAYHQVSGEPQGQESCPTHYWRDRTKDGPTYHIDYVFLPPQMLRDFQIGTFEDWTGRKLSDHVPLVVDIA